MLNKFRIGMFRVIMLLTMFCGFVLVHRDFQRSNLLAVYSDIAIANLQIYCYGFIIRHYRTTH